MFHRYFILLLNVSLFFIQTDFCMAKVKFLLPFNMPLYFFLYPLEQFKNEIKMPQGSQVVNDLLLLLTLHFFLFNMCITASPPSSSSENETRRPRFLSYRVTNTRITQKMFIYILFYIDLTVQLDPEQLRG